MAKRNLNTVARAGITIHLLCTAVPDVSAHSGVNLPPPNHVADDMVTAQYRIVHACTTDTGQSVPVIALSFMLPTQNAVLSRPDGGKIQDTDKNGRIDMDDISDNGSLAGLIQPFVDRSVFGKIQRKIDDLENPIGFSGTEGEVPDKFYADIPFALVPTFFKVDTCATELIVHPVAADICRITRNPRAGDVNIWMEHPTTKFPNLVHGVGENALLITYKRNLTSNPLKKRCGAGYAVDVFASDEDIDAHLPIPGVWPKP